MDGNIARADIITYQKEHDFEPVDIASRLAAMTALAKEMQKIVCDEYCGYGFTPRQHDEKCLSFQQRIKSIEENQ